MPDQDQVQPEEEAPPRFPNEGTLGRSITRAFDDRMAAMDEHPEGFPIHLGVDETEETIRILWEFVGHMGDDVGYDGYEFRLLVRARHLAECQQAAMLCAIAHRGPKLVDDTEATAAARRAARLDTITDTKTKP